jgi:leucyl-tRNA synthetase
MEYRFAEIEEKWKKIWNQKQLYSVTENFSQPKYYALSMFPYPSGAGLHVGHPLGYVACDIFARYKRLKGFNVLHPMGFDAFGLPAEQYAIETGTHPAETTQKAIARYREQLDKIGFSYDWSRQVVTCHPEYYKWTQWMFLKMFNSWYNREKNKAEPIETLIQHFETHGCTLDWQPFNPDVHEVFSAADWKRFSSAKKEFILQHYRLAYRSYTEVNWCEALGCVLANDEVKDGKSERGGYPVERRKMRQWSLRITEYADRLLEGLNRIDWSQSIKDQQRNWIGKSEGCLVNFMMELLPLDITVFTTRVDTIFGATFLVIAPEHEALSKIVTANQKAAIDEYLAYVKSRSDIERQQEKKVTGCFTGSYAIHPFTKEKIPVWTAEYVLAGYGTGAVMGVPADDERDRKFAEKFGLPIVEIIDKSMYPNAGIEDKVGKMINSDFLNGLEVAQAIETMTLKIEELHLGKRKINYKLRDASFSRQRYWGEPFPIRYQVQGKIDSPFVLEEDKDIADIPVALPEEELPLLLPPVDSFKPTGDGRSPLAHNKEWVNQNYETDTMPGYAGSSWYFLRYTDPHNHQQFAAKEKLDYWNQVDLYVGGSEHAVGHLLYARFFTKVLFDLGYINFDEPFKKLVNQGMIQGRSAFVYRLKWTNSDLSFPYQIFVSKEIWDDFCHNPQTPYEFLSRLFKRNDETSALLPVLLSGISELDVTKIRVDIALLDEEDTIESETFLKKYGRHGDVCFSNLANGRLKTEREVEKMSKSKYNVVNPDDVIAKYGADTFRLFEMFLGPIELSKPWDDKGITGCYNFLRKLWRLFYDQEGNWLVQDREPTRQELKSLHKLLKKVEQDIEQLSFNTAVSAFMICVNELTELQCHSKDILQNLVIALAPLAPFITEELHEKLGNANSVHTAVFPPYREEYLVEDSFTYPVSVNGKLRATIELPLSMEAAEVEQKVLALEQIKKWTDGKPIKKFIFIKGKIANIVV